MPNRRTGPIARLPKALRDVVNLMLLDGASYKEIREKLADHAHKVTESNISNWKLGGHVDWLNEQARLDDMQAKREFAIEIAKHNDGSKVQEAGLALAASTIYELLTEIDIDLLKVDLAEHPERFPQVVNALTKLSKSSLEYDKYRDVVAEQKRKIEGEVGKLKASGLTPENIAKIEEALNLL